MAKLNNTCKDRLFRLVFSDKQSLLELYNGINSSSYQNPEELEITTLEDVVYISMKNDLSFLVDDVLNLYEHQSTYNPNMPVRGFFYLAGLYRKYVEQHKLNLYSTRQIKLPEPNYVVFYNGLKNEQDRVILKLSDAFEHSQNTEPCLELRAVMLNINLGHNLELMERCQKLKQYAQFVCRMRQEIVKTQDLETAVDRVVAGCIQDGILQEFLSGHRAEVQNVILTEYNEQEHIAMERAEAKEEGIREGEARGEAKGEAKGKAKSILELLELGGMVSPELRTMILSETNGEILSRWLKFAAKAEDLEDFINMIYGEDKTGLTQGRK